MTVNAEENFTSILMLSEVLQKFRTNNKVPLTVRHANVPPSSWPSLQSQLRVSPRSYMALEAITSIDCPGSPYKELALPETLDVILSVNFLRNLSQRPEFPDFAFLQTTDNPKLAKETKLTATDDLTKFIRLRLRELKVGGKLIVTLPYARNHQKRGFIGQFLAHAWNRLAEIKAISQTERAALVIAEVFRTEEEVDACLETFNDRAEVTEKRVLEITTEAYDEWILNQKDWDLAKHYTDLTLAIYADEIERALANRTDEDLETAMTNLRAMLTDVFVDHCPKALFTFHILALTKL